jgi:histidinol dehydrogenase
MQEFLRIPTQGMHLSAGDYASGTNHTLPTNGYAELVVAGFWIVCKSMTFQNISNW